MSRKKITPTSDGGEIVTVYELVERPDQSLGVGNSIQIEKREAVLLILQRRAKHESAPIGELPDGWSGGVEEVEDGDHKHE